MFHIQTETLSDKTQWSVTVLNENDAALHGAAFAIDKKLSNGADYLYKSATGPAFQRMKIDLGKNPAYVMEVVIYLQRDDCCESHHNIDVR